MNSLWLKNVSVGSEDSLAFQTRVLLSKDEAASRYAESYEHCTLRTALSHPYNSNVGFVIFRISNPLISPSELPVTTRFASPLLQSQLSNSALSASLTVMIALEGHVVSQSFNVPSQLTLAKVFLLNGENVAQNTRSVWPRYVAKDCELFTSNNLIVLSQLEVRKDPAQSRDQFTL